jgi:hypothetical protein
MDPVLGAACQWCGAALPAGARYCRNCGRSQPTTLGVPADVTLGTQPMPGWPCPSCGSLLPAGARYCWDCGQPVAAAETEETDQRRKIAGLALEGLGILSAGENLGAHGVPVPGAAAGPQVGAPTVPGVAAGPQTGASSVPSASAGPQAGASNVPGASAGPQAGMNYQSPNFSNTVTQPGTSGASGGAGGGSGGGTSGGNTSGGSGGGKPGKKKSPSQPSGGQGGSILTVPHLIIFSLVIVLIAGISAVVIAAPNLLPGGKSAASVTNTPGPAPTSTPIIASAATVTITPTSQLEENTFTIEAVTGTPNAQQVQARQLSAKTQTYSKTINATGQGMTAGTHATGTLDIQNFTGNSITLSAGTIYNNNACDIGACPPIHMVLDQTLTIPANSGNRTVRAHVQEAGTIGNITTNGFAYRDNTLDIFNDVPFTGGTDPQPYTYVQQSDINNAANSLISANQPNAQQVLQSQVQANERFAGTPQCSPNVSANPPAGTQASQVTVSVNFTCTGEVYDYDGALMLAAQQLTTQATNNLGTAFALSGQIKTTLNSATPGNGGTVTLAIMAMGVWAYQFSAAQQSMLASMIAGKTPQMAHQILATQMGVAQVTIQLADTNAQVLPTNPGAITIVVQAVPGP